MKPALVPALLASLVLCALGPPAAAHEGFSANGWATQDDAPFRIFLSRIFDPNANPPPPGPSYSVLVTDLDLNALVAAFFPAEDNFVPDEVGGPLFVNPAFHAESDDPTVEFCLDGVQASNAVSGRGHFAGYDFVASSLVGV